jgi:hypothetical protein
VEEKDGGEKVRLGMVVSVSPYFGRILGAITDVETGHSGKLRCHARGFGENRWW